MSIFWKNTINAAKPLVCAVLFLSSCGGKDAKDYAEQWCELNSRIELSEDEKESEKLIKEMEALENEIKRTFSSNPDELQLLKKLTRECD